MWQPDPSWRRLPGAAGPSTAGIWLAEGGGGRRWVVKRLAAPGDSERWLTDPHHVGYWRREAEVAMDPAAADGPGLVLPESGPVEEDDTGITVWAREVEGAPPSGLFVARALGRFAGAGHASTPWAATRLLADRLQPAEERGGWHTLARTPLADVADRLWEHRRHWLGRCAEAPQGRTHGDAVPSNFLATRGEDVVTVDWQCSGTGPIGADLGYYALSAREGFDVLLTTFLAGAGAVAERVDAECVATSARVTAVYTVLTRAEWALAQCTRGEAARAGTFRHPSVAPHLRALQRQLPQIEQLLRP